MVQRFRKRSWYNSISDPQNLQFFEFSDSYQNPALWNARLIHRAAGLKVVELVCWVAIIVTIQTPHLDRGRIQISFALFECLSITTITYHPHHPLNPS